MSNSLDLKKVELDIPIDTIQDYLSTVGYRLLVIPDRVQTRTKSGIYTATDFDDSEALRQASVGRGTVVAIGPMAWKGIKGYDHDEGGDWCKVGDHIIYSKFSGKFLEDPVLRDPDNKDEPLKLAFINDEDVQAVIDDSKVYKLNKELHNNEL